MNFELVSFYASDIELLEVHKIRVQSTEENPWGFSLSLSLSLLQWHELTKWQAAEMRLDAPWEKGPEPPALRSTYIEPYYEEGESGKQTPEEVWNLYT